MNDTTGTFFFGPYRADSARRRLYRGDESLPVTPKVFDTLLLLLRHHGALVEKDVFMRALWPDTHVEEGNLAFNVATLRKLLGDTAKAHEYIATVPGRGYQFIAPVQVESRTTAVVEESDASVYALAVLPFKPLIESSRNEFFELGIADTLITRLGNLREVTVRPFAAVRHLTALDADPLDAARRLGVDAVLEGTIHSSAERFRITSRLFLANGRTLWSDRFEESGDLFAIEDRIAERVAKALGRTLTTIEQQRLLTRQTSALESYRRYVEGRYHWSQRTAPALRRAIDRFEEAVAIDPAHALAWTGLADSYALLPVYANVRPAEAFETALRAAREALAIDPELAEAHASLGAIHCDYTWQWDEAERELRRAIALKPNYATAHQWLCEYLTRMGRFEEARATAERAIELDPLSLITLSIAGMVEYSARDFDEALQFQQRALDLDPRFSIVRLHFVLSLFALGRFGEAMEMIEESRSDPSRYVEGWNMLLAIALWHLGRRDEAANMIEEAERAPNAMPSLLAAWHAATGNVDAALTWLERACDERRWLVTLLNVSPSWDRLADEPRFRELQKRIGLPDRPVPTRHSAAYF